MKTKIISFIFLPAFVMTAVHCNPCCNICGESSPPVLVRPESPPLVPNENDFLLSPIEAPPANSSNPDPGDFNDERFYGDYSSQNRLFGYYDHVPNSFDYCRERVATLFGVYESDGVDPISMIEITPEVMYVIKNGKRRIVHYTVEFRSGNGQDDSSIRFEIDGQTYRIKLIIPHDTTHIIGLMNGDNVLLKTQYYDATVTRVGDTVQVAGGTY